MRIYLIKFDSDSIGEFVLSLCKYFLDFFNIIDHDCHVDVMIKKDILLGLLKGLLKKQRPDLRRKRPY